VFCRKNYLSEKIIAFGIFFNVRNKSFHILQKIFNVFKRPFFTFPLYQKIASLAILSASSTGRCSNLFDAKLNKKGLITFSYWPEKRGMMVNKLI
jgi:hypothetical protein